MKIIFVAEKKNFNCTDADYEISSQLNCEITPIKLISDLRKKCSDWYVYEIMLPKEREFDLLSDIRKENPDVLITYNLAGFDRCTLTDAVAYNLVRCRQFHIITDGKLGNNIYLGKQLSLSMTFICVGDESERRAEDYLKEFPDIPEVIVVSRNELITELEKHITEEVSCL